MVQQHFTLFICGVIVSPALKVNPLILYLLQPSHPLSSHYTHSQACKVPRNFLQNFKWKNKSCITLASIVLCSNLKESHCPCTLSPLLLSVRWPSVSLATCLRSLSYLRLDTPCQENRELQDSNLEARQTSVKMAKEKIPKRDMFASTYGKLQEFWVSLGVARGIGFVSSGHGIKKYCFTIFIETLFFMTRPGETWKMCVGSIMCFPGFTERYSVILSLNMAPFLFSHLQRAVAVYISAEFYVWVIYSHGP